MRLTLIMPMLASLVLVGCQRERTQASIDAAIERTSARSAEASAYLVTLNPAKAEADALTAFRDRRPHLFAICALAPEFPGVPSDTSGGLDMTCVPGFGDDLQPLADAVDPGRVSAYMEIYNRTILALAAEIETGSKSEGSSS